MLLSENRVNSALLSTASTVALKGFPQANLTDADEPRRPTLYRGQFVVTAGVNDALNFTDTGARSAVVAPATYPNPAAFANAIAAAMNGAGGATDYIVYWDQSATNRNRFVIEKAASTVSLEINTGAGAATSCLRLLCGFRNADRTAAASHVADLAVIHQPTFTGATAGDYTRWDLATVKPMQAAVLVSPHLSPGARPYLDFGTSSATGNDAEIKFGDFDDELMCAFFTLQTHRYVALHLCDPHREDLSYVGAGLCWVGNWYAPSHTWTATSRSGRMLTSSSKGEITGTPFLSEMQAGDSFNFSLEVASDMDGLAEVLRSAGMNDRLAVALDPLNEPNRETRLCRLAAMPTLERKQRETRLGWWALNCSFVVEPVR
jgi:hypothetical protein